MVVRNWGSPPPQKGATWTDNSNTQFALLALWVAQRHGVHVRPALARVAHRFRTTQDGEGSWAYRTNSKQSRPSNTCAGLMGLAVGHGITTPGRGVRDEAAAAGLAYLGRTIDQAARRPGWRGRLSGVECMSDLYFFWSLERVAMVYGLRVLGRTEWYPWAAERLVAAQSPDGSWRNAYPGLVDTCFALLVLRRTNLATDLTATLRGRVPGQDPQPGGVPTKGPARRPAGPPAEGPVVGPARK
jgi:hypothetical protein